MGIVTNIVSFYITNKLQAGDTKDTDACTVRDVEHIVNTATGNWELFGKKIIEMNGKIGGELFAWCAVTTDGSKTQVGACLYHALKPTEDKNDFKPISPCIDPKTGAIHG